MATPSIDPYDIFTQADGFELTARTANEEATANNKRAFQIPAIVNSAFALELYLKCLLAIENTPSPRDGSGHDTSILFDLLTQRSKNKTKVYFMRALTRNPLLIKRHAEYVEAGFGPENPDIVDILEQTKNVFNEFRYIFEKKISNKNLPFHLLFVVSSSIRKVILNLMPEWDLATPPPPQDLGYMPVVSEQFKRDMAVVPWNKKNFGYVSIPLTCRNCSAEVSLAYVVAPNLKLPAFAPNGKIIIRWPKKDTFNCQTCSMLFNVSKLREYIEATHKKTPFYK